MQRQKWQKSALALRVLGSCTPNKCITIGRCSHLANPRVCPSRLAPSSLITSEYMIEGKQCHRIPTISRQVSVHNILSKSDKSSTYTDCWRHWVRNFRLSTDFAKIPFQSPLGFCASKKRGMDNLSLSGNLHVLVTELTPKRFRYRGGKETYFGW